MSLLIATPMYGGMCFSQHFLSCLELRKELINIQMPHSWCVLRNESLISRARNTCVATFMESEHSHLLFIDADIEFSPQDVAHLWNLAQEHPVVAGAYPMKDGSGKMSAWKGSWLTRMDVARMSVPEPVDYAGTGFMMISRHCLDEMVETYRGLEYEENGPKIALFDTEVTLDGVYLSEDFVFCQRWRDMGGEIWLHPRCELKHWGQCGY